MKSLFDTMALVSWCKSGNLPEKWQLAWNRCAYEGTVLIMEPLVSEIYYQLAKAIGHESAQNGILKIKGLKGVRMFPIEEDDDLAMEAGRIHLKAQQNGSEVSFVDAYLIAICKKTGAMIHTTDHAIRDIARRYRCKVNWLPLNELGDG